MKRPLFLTIWLAILVVLGIFNLYSYTLGSVEKLASLQSGDLWSILLIVFVLTSLIGYVLLYSWKKIGFYLVLVTMLLQTGGNFIFQGPAVGLVAIIITAIFVGILYLAMRPVWTNFN